MDISLMKGEIVSFKGSRTGIIVRCNEGMVWITVAGDERDHILSSGAQLAVSGRGKIVIAAEEKSSIIFYRPVKMEKKIQRLTPNVQRKIVNCEL